MRVRDMMSPNPVTIGLEDSLYTAKQKMVEANCRRLPVLDEQNRLCGIITDRDVRLAVNSPVIMRERWQDDLLLEHTQVGLCMTPDPVCVRPDMLLSDAVNLMIARQISGLPVLDGQQLIGIITVTDCLHALLRLLQTMVPVSPPDSGTNS